MIRLFVFFTLLFISSLSAVDFGEIKDFNTTTKSITVRHVSPAAFRPGQTLYIYRQKKEIGQMTVGMVHFSSLNGKLTSGDPKEKDIAIINQGDINKISGLKPESISFKELGSIAKTWIVKVSYTSKSMEAQTRPMVFLDSLGAREIGKEYYSQFPLKEIDSIIMDWDGSVFRGKSVVLKNKKKFAVDEILSNNIHKKLAPRESTEKMECIVKFMKQQETSKDIPDTLKITLKIEDAKSEYGDKHFFLKSYSNALFLEEFYIDPKRIAGDKFENEFHIPSYLLASGPNKIEFFLVEMEDSTGNFEKGESRLVGEKDMSVTQGDQKIQIDLKGDGKKIKVIK